MGGGAGLNRYVFVMRCSMDLSLFHVFVLHNVLLMCFMGPIWYCNNSAGEKEICLLLLLMSLVGYVL